MFLIFIFNSAVPCSLDTYSIHIDLCMHAKKNRLRTVELIHENINKEDLKSISCHRGPAVI